MDGPFRPYVQRYVTILIKISDQKTKLFASWGVRDLWVPATCPAVYPLHPTTPPDRWPTSELIFSARIAEMTMDFEWKKVISKMNIPGNYRYLQIWRSSSTTGAGERGMTTCAVAGVVWEAVVTL